MRREDIHVGGVYALGGFAPSKMEPWRDPQGTRGVDGIYTPAIVLESPNGYGVTVLAANYHPGTRPAVAREQASIKAASEYTAADHERFKNAVLVARRYRFDTTPNSVVSAVRAEREKLPRGWEVRVVRAQQLRLHWSDYAVEHQARLAKVREDREAADLAHKNALDRRKLLIQRASALGIDARKGMVVDQVRMELDDFERLLDGFPKP